jgi:hypothetical protein
VPRRPLWGLIAFLAFQTLPEPLKRLDGGPGHRALLAASLRGLRVARPLAPPRIRYVAPAVMAGWRLEGRYGSLAEAAAHWPTGPTGQEAGRVEWPPKAAPSSSVEL